MKAKKFSFYRDLIRKLDAEDCLWDELLALPLTDIQRKLVIISRPNELNKRYTLMQIAGIFGCGQPSITKMWGGLINKRGGKSLGGIFNKYKKSIKEPNE